MTIFTVTPASNLASVISGAGSGDTVLFMPGTYSVGTALNLSNGVTYLGNPGAVLIAAGNNDIFDIFTGGTNNNINIMGLTFDGGASTSNAAGIYLIGNSGSTPSMTNISICYNTFQNFGGTVACIFCYQGDNLRFDNNIFNNIYQPFAIHNNDAGAAHSNVSISGNQMRGVARFGIEVQCLTHAYNNLNINYNFGIISNNGYTISVVDDSISSTGVNVIGNDSWGGAGIEAANKNLTATENRFTNCINGISIGHGTNSVFYGNEFRNMTIGQAFTQDGGWASGQWVGENLVNGSLVSGWPGHPNDGSIVIPKYVVRTQAEILSDLADTGADGRITAAVMRSVVFSRKTAGGIYSPYYP